MLQALQDFWMRVGAPRPRVTRPVALPGDGGHRGKHLAVLDGQVPDARGAHGQARGVEPGGVDLGWTLAPQDLPEERPDGVLRPLLLPALARVSDEAVLRGRLGHYYHALRSQALVPQQEVDPKHVHGLAAVHVALSQQKQHAGRWALVGLLRIHDKGPCRLVCNVRLVCLPVAVLIHVLFRVEGHECQDLPPKVGHPCTRRALPRPPRAAGGRGAPGGEVAWKMRP
mmetsp:Transcript_107597/g.304325  ORF Transcript_107597/g.304325 Transcript_107597/m.304325 type:complete len:227 (+) Transcript_107597:1156-1836(+)